MRSRLRVKTLAWVAITSLCVSIALTHSRAEAQYGRILKARNILVISDVDDTIRVTQAHKGRGLGKLRLNMISDYFTQGLASTPGDPLSSAAVAGEPFAGMPELYQALAKEGATFAYVSAIPNPIKRLGEAFLKSSHFPPGKLYGRGFKRGTLSLPSTQQHKEAVIRELVRQNPGKRIILLGDDGEHDPETFANLMADPEVAPKVDLVLMHEIYNRPDLARVMSAQTPFLTAADLATLFHRQGLLGAADTANLISIVSRRLSTYDAEARPLRSAARRHSAFPEFADVSPERIQEIIQKDVNSLPPSDPLREKLARLEPKILAQRERGGEMSCLRHALIRTAQGFENISRPSGAH